MTWGTHITKGNTGEPAQCYDKCKHGKPKPGSYQPPCYVLRASNVLGSLVTSIDQGADGHMASGTINLQCNGFEQHEPEGE